MIIKTEEELEGMKAAGYAAKRILNAMLERIEPGMNAKQLDDFAGELIKKNGANSAPIKAYDFPGNTCICVNEETAHGIPTKDKVFKEGDLVNLDVSLELDGYFSDTGTSFVLGEDIHGHNKLVEASKLVHKKALDQVRAGDDIFKLGWMVEFVTKQMGFTVVKALCGHGIGRSLHENPSNILNYYEPKIHGKFVDGMTVAIEVFISDKSEHIRQLEDGWTLMGLEGYTAQQEHTIMVTNNKPIILT